MAQDQTSLVINIHFWRNEVDVKVLLGVPVLSRGDHSRKPVLSIRSLIIPDDLDSERVTQTYRASMIPFNKMLMKY